MKVALFSPMPPERSGIADYSALLLPALRQRCDIVVVKRGSKRPPRGVDLSVYHIGNNPEAHGGFSTPCGGRRVWSFSTTSSSTISWRG